MQVANAVQLVQKTVNVTEETMESVDAKKDFQELSAINVMKLSTVTLIVKVKTFFSNVKYISSGMRRCFFDSNHFEAPPKQKVVNYTGSFLFGPKF